MVDYTRAEARLPLLIFGDGMVAQQLRIRKGVDSKEGVVYDEIRLRPTPTLKYYFGILDDELDPIDQGIVKRYPTDMIKVGNSDPSVGCFFVMCDYNGKTTPLMNLHSDLLYSCQAKDRKIKALQYENAALHQERKRLTGQQARNIKETFEMFKPAAAFRAQELGTMANQSGQQKSGSDEVVYEGP